MSKLLTVRSQDPIKALRDLPDLPIKHPEQTQGLKDRFEALEARVQEARVQEGAAWGPLYEEGVGLVEGLLAVVRAREESLEQEIQGLEAQRAAASAVSVSAGPASHQEARVVLDALESDLERHGLKLWERRLKSQQEELLTKLMQDAEQKLLLEEEPLSGQVELRVEGAWWAKFEQHVEAHAAVWREQVSAGAAQSMGERCALRCEELRELGLAPLPEVAQPAAPAGAMAFVGTKPPVKRAEVPGMAEGLFVFMRSNLMTVGILGSLVGALLIFAEKVLGFGGLGAGTSAMALRGGLLLVALPPLCVAGWFAARKQRVKLRTRAVEELRREVLGFVQSEINRALERERRALWLWVTTHHEDWKREIKAYDRSVVGKLVRESRSQASQQGRQASQLQRQLQREQRQLQSLLTKLQDTTLLELKRRARELTSPTTTRP